jgi:hypothetical protein
MPDGELSLTRAKREGGVKREMQRCGEDEKKVGMTEGHSLIAFSRAPARHDSVLLSMSRAPVAC